MAQEAQGDGWPPDERLAAGSRVTGQERLGAKGRSAEGGDLPKRKDLRVHRDGDEAAEAGPKAFAVSGVERVEQVADRGVSDDALVTAGTAVEARQLEEKAALLIEPVVEHCGEAVVRREKVE